MLAPFNIYNRSQGTLVASEAKLARTIWDRTRGLIGRPSLQEGEALILTPCSGVHMIGMRYDILAAYLDRHGIVLGLVRLRPGTLGPNMAGTRAVIEMPPSMIDPVRVGDHLLWCLSSRRIQVV